MLAEEEAKLTEIFRTLFSQDDLMLRDDLTAKDVPAWDSMNHINLILYVESEFAIRFTSDELSEFKNVGDLKRLIAQKTSGQ